MGKVRVIAAKKPNCKSKTTDEIKKIKVAAYARVSTDHSDQETSYEAQQTHFKGLIENNPSWELVGIYADEESGTSANSEGVFRKISSTNTASVSSIKSRRLCFENSRSAKFTT